MKDNLREINKNHKNPVNNILVIFIMNKLTVKDSKHDCIELS